MSISESNTLRFKNGETEFELTGSPDQIAKAWDALAEVVTRAFASPRPAASEAPAPTVGVGGEAPKRKSARRSNSQGSGKPAVGRAEVIATLLQAELGDFPDVVDAKARWQGYALLNWAKERHNFDGLSVNEIQAFYQDRFGVPNTPGAYREAFRGKGREVVKSGTPAVFRLMRDGKAALDSYLAKVEAGASHEDAAAAAAEEEAGQE